MLNFLPPEFVFWFAGLCALAVTLLGGTMGYCLVRRKHVWGEWKRESLAYDINHCRVCGMKGYRENPRWAGLVGTDLQQGSSPFAETAELPLRSSETGTSEIPRLSNGALTLIPVPPVIHGGRHAVLDHE